MMSSSGNSYRALPRRVKKNALGGLIVSELTEQALAGRNLRSIG